MTKMRLDRLFYVAIVSLFVLSLTTPAFAQGKGRGGEAADDPPAPARNSGVHQQELELIEAW